MAALPIPAVGSVVDGYRFLGGNPNDKKNWESVAAPIPVPKVGEVLDGYRFKGGNPNDQASWEKVSRPSVAEESSTLRQAADLPVGFAKGVASGVRMIADAFGAGSEASKSIKNVEDYLGSLLSAQAIGNQKEVARIMKDAENKGVLEQVKAGFKSFATAPVDTAVQALGTSAPVIIASLGSMLLAPAAIPAATVAGATAIGLGAVMGAGTVKGTIYEETKKALKEVGVDDKRAEEIAIKAQEYKGENLDMILLGSGIGGVAGRVGLEGNFIRGLANKITANVAARDAAKEAAKTGTLAAAKRVGVAAATEAIPEIAQGAQEKVAENIALQRVGKRENIPTLAETPTMRGVVAAGTLEGLAGAALGGGLSIPEAVRIAKASGATDQDINALQAAIEVELAQKEQTVAAPQEARKEQITAERQAVLDKAAAQQEIIDRVVEQQALRKLGLADTPASAVKKASNKVDALKARVDDLTDDYIAAGASPSEAKIKAAAQAAEEEKYDRANLEELENAAKSISAAGGTSPEVPSRPRRATTPEGTLPPPPSGVAPPPVAPGQVDVGAREPDVALTPPVEPPAPVEPPVPAEPVEETAAESDKKVMRAAVADLVELAQGYSATPEQIGTIAQKYDIEPWKLEGVWFDILDKSETEATSPNPLVTEEPIEAKKELPSAPTPTETVETKKEAPSGELSPVRKLALEEQKKAGWDSDWPMVPADMANATFRNQIATDPNLSQEEKLQIFTAAKNLGVITEDQIPKESVEPKAEPKVEAETEPKTEPKKEPPSATSTDRSTRDHCNHSIGNTTSTTRISPPRADRSSGLAVGIQPKRPNQMAKTQYWIPDGTQHHSSNPRLHGWLFLPGRSLELFHRSLSLPPGVPRLLVARSSHSAQHHIQS